MRSPASGFHSNNLSAFDIYVYTMNSTTKDKMIRIGTLVRGGCPKVLSYLQAIRGHGFESYQLNNLLPLGDPNRLVALADTVMPEIEDQGAVVSSLAVFGNPLSEGEAGEKARAFLRGAIVDARRFGASIVAGFTGAVSGASVPESMARFSQVWTPLADLAGEHDVKLVFENCPMNGDWRRTTTNLAFCPDAWELIFEALPHTHVGLEWEPCHQMCQLIDPLPQLKAWLPKVFHLHGKDASVYRDVIARHGISGPHPIAEHRHPGFGDTNWTDLISILRSGGYCGTIDIEGWHDPVYRDDLEMTGQVRALEYLKRCRGGDYVPNP